MPAAANKLGLYLRKFISSKASYKIYWVRWTFLGAIFINFTKGYMNFIVLFMIKLKSKLKRMSASSLRRSDFVKAFADKWTSSLIYGTLYVSSYLAAIKKAVAPRSWRFSFPICFFMRYLSIIITTVKRVSGNILNLRCKSTSQSMRIPRMLALIYFCSDI